MKYKMYIILCVVALVLLFIIQPKFILKIKVVKEEPQFSIDKGRFVLCWLVLSGVLSLGYVMISKMKKPC